MISHWATRHVRKLLLAYGVLFAVVGIFVLGGTPRSSLTLQGARADSIRGSISVLDRGGPPLLGSDGGQPVAPEAGDDPGAILYLSLLGHAVGSSDPLQLLKWMFVGAFALLFAVYPILWFELLSSAAAALISPLLLLFGFRFLAVHDIYWVAAWCILLCIPLIALTFAAAIAPLNDFDGRAFWVLKAKGIAHERSIDGPFFHGGTHDPRNQYPILIPLDGAVILSVAHDLDDRQLRWLYVALLAALALLVRERVGQSERFQKATYQLPQLAYIGWNEARPFFADKRVRQALTMLVDRPNIIETVRKGMGAPATSPFPPSSPDFDTAIQPWPYDPKRAGQLLDEAGWIDHNGNGIRDKNGVEFNRRSFQTSTTHPAGFRMRANSARARSRSNQ